MTPEELDRTIEFIINSQARLAAAQEQDRHDRIAFERRLADIQRQQADLLVHQSERLDSFQKLHEKTLEQNENFQHQALGLLNMILDRLSSSSQTRLGPT